MNHEGPNMTDDIPRRSRLEHMTPAERAIYDAVGVVEQAGCDVRLTEAVMWLQKARDRVADFVDGVQARRRVHFDAPPHHGCHAPAECDCECRRCKRIWEGLGRPGPAHVGGAPSEQTPVAREVLDRVVAEREDYRMKWTQAQHETALAEKRIKSLEDGIVAENRRTSAIEAELRAVKDLLIARDEDYHPDGLVSVAKVVVRILGERDGARSRFAEAERERKLLAEQLYNSEQSELGLVAELDSVRSMLAELAEDPPGEFERLKSAGETGAAVSALLSSNKNLANSLEAQSRALDVADERASTATDILCVALGADHGRGGLRRAVGRLVVGGYGGSRRDSIALTFADRADVRRDVVLLRDQLAAWLEDRRRTTIFLSGEWRDTSDGDPSGGADVLPDHDDSSGSGAAQADVAQRGQSNEGTHGPLDRPAPPEPAGVHTIRVAWKALPPREQLRCLLSLVEEWGYYGKGLGGSGAATMGDATVGGDETRAPEPAGDCRDVETKLAMSRAELSRTRVAFRNFVGEYERCVPRSARLHPRMVSAEKKLDDLFLHVVEPAEPESVTAKRDSEWVWAMAQALGTNSGLSVPIVPDVEAFRKLFEEVRARARVHAKWAEIPRPYTKPKLTELVSREQLVAACREALKSPSWWGAFEKLASVLEKGS